MNSKSNRTTEQSRRSFADLFAGPPKFTPAKKKSTDRKTGKTKGLMVATATLQSAIVPGVFFSASLWKNGLKAVAKASFGYGGPQVDKSDAERNADRAAFLDSIERAYVEWFRENPELAGSGGKGTKTEPAPDMIVPIGDDEDWA
jgi:hypothetical protein